MKNYLTNLKNNLEGIKRIESNSKRKESLNYLYWEVVGAYKTFVFTDGDTKITARLEELRGEILDEM